MNLTRICIVFLNCLFVFACEQREFVSDRKQESPVQFQIDRPSQLGRNQGVEILPPPDVERTATGIRTPIILGQPSVVHSGGRVQLINDAPESGFPPGKTIVTWTATDSLGNVATATQVVNVKAAVACATEKLFFAQRVWPLLEAACAKCHNSEGVSSHLNFVSPQVADFLDINYLEMQRNSFLLDSSGTSVFLAKTSNINNDHGGELIFSADSSEYQVLSNMIQRFGLCNQVKALPEQLVYLGPVARLRKTTLSTAGRLPTLAEIERVRSAIDENDLQQKMSSIIDGVFLETGFFQRLKEIYNDVLLTDAYGEKQRALNLYLEDYVNSNYFSSTELMLKGYNAKDSNTIMDGANFGISQAPLELLVHIVKNNLPITEMLTADYLMVNPFSATIFNANISSNPDFNFYYGENIQAHDYRLFLPAKIFDRYNRPIPHAGILNTLVFLNRYPTSTTNMNRKRARYIFKYFLDTDVEGLADRASLNLDNVIGQFPTLEDPQCKRCHDIIDPVAGLFKNWDAKARYLGNNQYWWNVRTPPQMLPPGYSANLFDQLPTEQGGSALQWLGRRIATDDRFVTSTVKTLFSGFTSIDAMMALEYLQQLKSLLIASNYNIKPVIKKILTSPYFLAENANPLSLDPQLPSVGTAQLLSPEQLSRKISAIFPGYEWVSPSRKNLLDAENYRLLYGGIDSIDNVSRAQNPTTIMAGIQARIANQASCTVVPADFALSPNQRYLFPFVSFDDLPNNDFSVASIKQNLQYLFAYILGQEVAVDSPELLRAYDLFLSILNSGVSGPLEPLCVLSLSPTDPVVLDPLNTIKAWSAVVNYMLRDFVFLYE